jgi:hypothetical protein
MAGSTGDSSHEQSVDCAIRELIADGLLEEHAKNVIKATTAVSAFDQLGL